MLIQDLWSVQSTLLSLNLVIFVIKSLINGKKCFLVHYISEPVPAYFYLSKRVELVLTLLLSLFTDSSVLLLFNKYLYFYWSTTCDCDCCRPWRSAVKPLLAAAGFRSVAMLTTLWWISVRRRWACSAALWRPGSSGLWWTSLVCLRRPSTPPTKEVSVLTFLLLLVVASLPQTWQRFLFDTGGCTRHCAASGTSLTLVDACASLPVQRRRHTLARSLPSFPH